jgi:hypothetical protein
MMTYRMNLLSARSISLDSTFKANIGHCENKDNSRKKTGWEGVGRLTIYLSIEEKLLIFNRKVELEYLLFEAQPLHLVLQNGPKIN